MHRVSSITAASAATSAALLSWSAPGAYATATAPGADFAAVLGGFAGLVAVGLQLWLSFGAALTLLAAGQSRAAAFAGCLARRVVPGWWYRTVCGALGSAVVSLPLLPPAAVQAATCQPEPAAVALPAADGRDVADQTPTLDGLPYPDRPFGGLPPRAKVVVRPGDTLWSIAAASLGRRPAAAAVAATWPAWYRANRALIGPDPDLIIPGTALAPPPPHTLAPGGPR